MRKVLLGLILRRFQKANVAAIFMKGAYENSEKVIAIMIKFQIKMSRQCGNNDRLNQLKRFVVIYCSPDVITRDTSLAT